MKMAGLIFDHYKVRPGLKRFIIGHGFEYDHKSIKSIVYERGMKEYNIINKILANEKMLHLYGLAKLQDILVLRKAFCSSVSMGKIKIDSKDVRKALSIWPKYRDLSSQAIPIQPDANLRETRELNLRRLQLDRDIFILLSFNRGEEMIKNLAKHNNPSTWESRISVIKDIVSTKPMWTKGMFSSITRSEDTNIINQAYTFIHNMTKDRIQAICTKMELVYLYPDVLFENKSRMKILNRIKSYLKVPMDNDVAIFGIANFKWIKTLKEFAKVEDSVKWVSNLKLDTPYFDFDKLEDVEDERFVLKLIKTKDLAERVAREHQHCLYISYWDGRGYGYQLFCVMDKRDNLIGSAEVKMGILDGRLTHTVAQYRGNHNAELDTHNLEILLDKYFARPEVNISLVHNYCQDKGATNHPNLFNPLLGQ